MQNQMLIMKLERELGGSKIRNLSVGYEDDLLHVFAESDYQNIEAYMNPARYNVVGIMTTPKSM